MVDPNPARGMPLPLQRYWLTGKGGAKIRWRMPHDFDRCVRNLRKYFPTNPQGLCNILHQKAVGAPPGKGHPGSHSITASMFSAGTMITDRDALVAAQELMDKQPKLGRYTWAGPIAPIGRPTEEPRQARVFEQGALRHRMLPLPLDWRERVSEGHNGALTVGRQLGIVYGPDHHGLEYAWAWGDYLDEEIIPEARKARYLTEMGVAGASVDPGGRIIGMLDPATGATRMAEFTIGGATLVPIPAFSAMRLYVFDADGDWPDDDPDMSMEGLDHDDDCGCGDKPRAILASGASFTVNPSGWRGLPLAPRDAVFDNDDAVKRITAWANVSAQGADINKLRRAFMWYDPNLPPTDPTSYRLPVGDVINGELTLIYHAIYAAAALLSGAHGGLPGINENDRTELRNVISEIYPEMAREFNDASIRAPWDRSAAEGIQLSASGWVAPKETDYSLDWAEDQANESPWGSFAAKRADIEMSATGSWSAPGEDLLYKDLFAATEPYGDVKYADPGYRDNRKRYPIDTPDHIRAAWAYINVAKNQAEYTDEQVAAIKAKIQAAAKKAGIEISDDDSDDEMAISKKRTGRMKSPSRNRYSMDTTFPVEPPAAWFSNPALPARTPLTVEPNGRVFGHIAAWGECHRDFAGRECVLAPKSRKGYEPFHLGTVYTAEGDPVRVGKIVMDTRHADIGLGYTAAAIHYDNTGDEVAVVRAGEDQFGIWVAGAVVPEATPAKVAKLRRSPISGDWRRVDGNLELTAALAVNVPAFPVYAMDGEDQLALVAAGTLEPAEVQEPPTGIDSSLDLATIIRTTVEDVFTSLQERQQQDEEHQERLERLRDLLEDEEIYASRAREARFSALTAAAQPPEPVPPPLPPQVAPQGQAPAPAPVAPAPADGTPPTWPPDDAKLLEMQMDARYSIIEEPDEEAVTSTGADRQGAASSTGSPAPAPGQTPPQPQAQA